MRKSKTIPMIAAIAIFSSACATPIGHFRLLSKASPETLRAHGFIKDSGRVPASEIPTLTKEACNQVVWALMFVVSSNPYYSIDQTLVSLRKENPKIESLTDFEIKSSNLFALFYAESCFKVLGKLAPA